MRTKLIIANWKENPDKLEIAEKLLKVSKQFLSSNKSIYITHAVPNLFAGIFKKKNPNENIILQNISSFKEGSHTGEVSARQAKNLNISMSIVGHSESRLSPENPHGDEDKEVNEKIKNLLEENMISVLCVGEYSRGTDKSYLNFVENELGESLKGLTENELKKIVFAYEPVWAIGEKAKRPATMPEILEMILFIKNYLHQKVADKNFNWIVLYGGSVNEDNAKEILESEIVDGLLVGRASSDPAKWSRLLDSLS